MKKIVKLVILLTLPGLISACASQPSVSSNSSNESSASISSLESSTSSSESSVTSSSSSRSSSSSNSSKPIIPPSYDCFIVELIDKDDYKTNEFNQAFVSYKEKNGVTYTSANPTLDIANVMPHNIVDAYGVSLFTVRTTDANQTYDDAYLYYNNELFRVSPMTVRSNEENFTVFGNIVDVAFTNVNKDSAYEVTVSYRYEDGGFVYLTTLDFNSGEMVNSYYGMRNEYSLKKKDNAIAIYQDNEFLAYIDSYARDFSLNEPTVTLTSTNYKVDITWSKFETCVPVDYPNLEHRFKVDVDMTYTGETFTYEGSYYLETARVSFYKGDKAVQTYELAVDTGIKTHTITQGQHLKETYYFFDAYQQKNSDGTYDIEAIYRNEKVSKENVLTIK